MATGKRTTCRPSTTSSRSNDDIYKRVETVGRPLPGIEIKLLDSRTGGEVDQGEQGEVCCRGYNVMQGYYKMEEAARLFLPEENAEG